jgi:hypothetical protein
MSNNSEIFDKDINTNINININDKDKKIEQIDIENCINALEIEKKVILNEFNNNEFTDLRETKISKTSNEDLILQQERKPNNIFKRMSSFFINEQIDEKHLHPNINLKKNIIEDDKNEDIEIAEDKVKEISETISKENDLFEIEEQSKIIEHQIDLINMDRETEEIDEKVLEIPAFLRRQAN